MDLDHDWHPEASCYFETMTWKAYGFSGTGDSWHHVPVQNPSRRSWQSCKSSRC